MEVIVGTAGHIDHGKTALVKALTGTDADRLPEEKRRGITVDLGFAEMRIRELHLGFVDVPGHERFLKNMLAGASGIDLVMLVIAADGGVMPQTREHFDICRLLGLNAGLVVMTKTDLVDAETLDLARLDAAALVAGTFLEKAPVVSVSSRTGEGIESLKGALVEICACLVRPEDRYVTRLPIDRSFSMKGFGAVVTGTLASGEIAEGAEMELLPDGFKVRVRGLQTHGQPAVSVTAPARVAVNLGGIDHSKIERGMVLVEPNTIRPSQLIDAEIEVLPGAAKALRSRQRMRFHIGTIEALARIHVLNDKAEIAAGETDLVQIRLEVPVATVPGERFILRSYSPQATVAGGQVVDMFAVKHRGRDIRQTRAFLYELIAAQGDIAATVRVLVAAAGPSGLTEEDLGKRSGWRPEVLVQAIDKELKVQAIVDAGGHYVTTAAFDDLTRALEGALVEFHRREPLAKGMSREAMREGVLTHLPQETLNAVIARLESAGTVLVEKEMIRLASHKATLSPAEADLSSKILGLYRQAGLQVPKLDETLDEAVTGTGFAPQDARKLLQLSLDNGQVVKVTDEFYFLGAVIEGLSDTLRKFADRTADRLIDVAAFKELAGVSRKYAIPLLEYFDREKVTRRAGDKRLIL